MNAFGLLIFELCKLLLLVALLLNVLDDAINTICKLCLLAEGDVGGNLDFS